MILPIKESLIKYVFEPAAKQVRKHTVCLPPPLSLRAHGLLLLTKMKMLILPQKAELRAAVREMRGR